MTTAIKVNFLLEGKRSRWHLVRVAFDAPEESRPHFLNAFYPAGRGVTPESGNEARLVSALGKQAIVSVSSDVDESGHPDGSRFEKASEPLWGDEAIALLRRWRFAAAIQDVHSVKVRCTGDLVWQEKALTEELPKRDRRLLRQRARIERGAPASKRLFVFEGACAPTLDFLSQKWRIPDDPASIGESGWWRVVQS